MRKVDAIYHYTTVSSAVNIIQSGKIFACDAKYLNDANELTFATKLFCHAISERYNISINLFNILNNFTRSYCVSCFSESPEILSQWKSYSNDGKGLCLGFSRSIINHTSGPYPSKLVNCVYDNHDEFINNIINNNQCDIDSIISISKGIMRGDTDLEKQRKSIDNIYTELLRIKNKNFHEEREVRLIFCVPTMETKKLVKNDVIIPYIEHPFCEDEKRRYMWCHIPEIWLGPKCDSRNDDAIKSFMQLGWNLNSEDGFGTYRFDCGYR